MRKLSIGHKLYISIMSVFLVFAVAFIVFQQQREKQFKIDTLELRLQMFNARMADFLADEPFSEHRVDSFLRKSTNGGMRITLVRPDGKVMYDNVKKDYEHFANHRNRDEIRLSLAKGKASVVDRRSKTLHQPFFYSATYYPQQHLVIRSALPYNNDLALQLKADQHYIWVSLIGLMMLTLIIYRFVSRLDKNISNLKTFASRADHNESLDTDDLLTFPDDELGEIAERIIKIYTRLKNTKKQQDILKKELTQNIAHELKTPVASIQGYVETILNNPRITEDDKHTFLQRCYAQTERLSALLADISMLNRMDDGAQMMENERVDINELIATIEAEITQQLAQHDMRFECSLPDGMYVMGVRSLLYSVFRNLADNAIAYAGAHTTITLTAERVGEDFCFVFADTGVGVSYEHLPRIFERFYRIDKGRSRKLGGTGLGLAIVKNAVLHHGGNIQVMANDPTGLKFVFTLGAST